MATDISSSEELSALQSKRTTLQKIIRIALAVERLNESLQSVVALGKPVSSTSPNIKKLMALLEQKVRLQPSVKIKETLAHLEKSIQGKLEIILEIAEMDDEQLVNLDADEEQVEKLLQIYAKNSQTAVALKGILHSRGEVTRVTEFSVNSDIIVKKLAEVSARERTCRNRVTLSIMTMIDDAKDLLKDSTLPEAMQNMLQVTVDNLNLDLSHIQSGKSIETMPVPIEIVEIEGDEVTSLESGRDKQQHFTPTETAPALKPEEKKQAPKERSFFEKVMRWLSTPKNITWDDIQSGRD